MALQESKTPEIDRLDHIEIDEGLFGLVEEFDSRFAGKYLVETLMHPDEALKACLADIESRAYSNTTYGERSEGAVLFTNQYRGVENHTPINYVILNDSNKDRPVAFFSFFFTADFIFEDTRNAYKLFDKDQSLNGIRPPIMVVSKLVRDPEFAAQLATDGKPQRDLLAATIIELALGHENGILIEANAQPDTLKLLTPDIIGVLIPGSKVIYSQPNSPKEDSDSTILLYIPNRGANEL